mmetsp:Transcript_8406/g.26660  ORF Transcript_8406/g.26660 Transcript_8406/m.26660 type:complete len:201 (+) Transcript_8406:990-1592(+)
MSAAPCPASRSSSWTKQQGTASTQTRASLASSSCAARWCSKSTGTSPRPRPRSSMPRAGSRRATSPLTILRRSRTAFSAARPPTSSRAAATRYRRSKSSGSRSSTLTLQRSRSWASKTRSLASVSPPCSCPRPAPNSTRLTLKPGPRTAWPSTRFRGCTRWWIVSPRTPWAKSPRRTSARPCFDRESSCRTASVGVGSQV